MKIGKLVLVINIFSLSGSEKNNPSHLFLLKDAVIIPSSSSDYEDYEDFEFIDKDVSKSHHLEEDFEFIDEDISKSHHLEEDFEFIDEDISKSHHLKNDSNITSYNKSIETWIKEKPTILQKNQEPDFKIWLEMIEKYYGGRKKEKISIIEVGSGSGENADFLETKGFQIERTDAAEKFVELQKTKGSNAQVFNVLKNEFKQCYGMIILPCILNEIPQKHWKPVLEKVKNYLVKNDGALALSLRYSPTGSSEEMVTKNGNDFNFYYKSREEIFDFLKETNFTICMQCETEKLIGFVLR